MPRATRLRPSPYWQRSLACLARKPMYRARAGGGKRSIRANEVGRRRGRVPSRTQSVTLAFTQFTVGLRGRSDSGLLEGSIGIRTRIRHRRSQKRMQGIHGHLERAQFTATRTNHATPPRPPARSPAPVFHAALRLRTDRRSGREGRGEGKKHSNL